MKMTLRRLLRGANRKPSGGSAILLAPPSRSPAEQVDYRAIGDKHRDLKQWKDAVEAYTRHLELHPEDDAIWVQCGNCLKEAGEFSRSLAAYKKAEQLNPINSDVHLQLGHLHKITGDLREAMKCYEQAALLNPNLGDARHEINNTMDLIKASLDRPLPQISHLFTSMEQLIKFLEQQPEEQDIFSSYFRSVSGR